MLSMHRGGYRGQCEEHVKIGGLLYTHKYNYTIIQSVFKGEIGENLLKRIQDSSFEMNVSSQGSHLKIPLEHMMKVG